jgi:hypothetical protein
VRPGEASVQCLASAEFLEQLSEREDRLRRVQQVDQPLGKWGKMGTLPYFAVVSPVFSSVFFSRVADKALQARDEACRPPPERPV